MLPSLIASNLPTLARIGADPGDSDDVRLKKSALVLASLLFIPISGLWGLLYLAFNGGAAGPIALSYAGLTCISLAVFALTRRYSLLMFSQLFLMLILPVLVMLALGGFVRSSGVVLWALLSPVGALLFDTPRRAMYWLAAYLGLLALSVFFEFRPLVLFRLSPAMVMLFFPLNVGAVSTITIVLLAYFVAQKDELLVLLHNEQVKSENLLLNILPREIAAILKNESRTIADHYTEVSVLFADMVGFTPLSACLEPVQVVELLNEAFSFFDSLLDKHGVEKIRTIGDSYMAASGMPRRRKDHAQALVCMALEMRDFTAAHTFANGRRVNFRIGINSGPVVAGVIGKRKFVYDVWGDAVNVASRMESHGVGGEVQITRPTYELIKDEFVCEPRGSLYVKGKGKMEVWLVRCAKA